MPLRSAENTPSVRTGPKVPPGTQPINRPDAPRPSAGEHHRVIVVGAPEDIHRALEHPAVLVGRMHVTEVLAVDVTESPARGFDRLDALLRDGSAEAVFIAGPLGPSAMRRVADLALTHHCRLLAVMPTEMLAEHSPRIVWSGDSPVVQLAGIPRHRWALAAKRWMDVVGAAVGLLVAAPLLAAIAVLIRLESPGSPLFRHERVGRRGRAFQCLKLRTMRMDAEDQLRADAVMYEDYRRNHFKIPDDRDPRVTPLGRLLRRYSLDELPQLWNVLMGEMSLVGPRPVVAEELELYGESRELLLSVRPGISGAWAVSGRQDVGYPERCDIELDYVRRWSLWRDFRIAVRTVAVVTRAPRL